MCKSQILACENNLSLFVSLTLSDCSTVQSHSDKDNKCPIYDPSDMKFYFQCMKANPHTISKHEDTLITADVHATYPA